MSKKKASIDPSRRENQLIAKAMELAEVQIENGTASSQIIYHFLKSGSEKDRLERDRLKAENDLLRAKVESLKSAQKAEELYSEAIRAMRSYAGSEDVYECEDTEN